MNSRPIAFLDSGIGGVPYLLAAREALPGAALVYYADNAHFPYGERSVSEVRRVVRDATARLIEIADPRMLVVACNTASVVALEDLRSRFEIPFVGVVPAIKPAATVVQAGRIGVLATSRTVEDRYVTDLIARFAPSAHVVLVAASGLVQLIEERLGTFTEDELEEALTDPVRQLREEGVEAVVLGCTHFIHVRDRIATMLGPGIEVVDSVAGVVRQTARVAGEDGAASGSQATPFFVSDLARAGSSYSYLSRRHRFDLSEVHERHSSHR